MTSELEQKLIEWLGAKRAQVAAAKHREESEEMEGKAEAVEERIRIDVGFMVGGDTTYFLVEAVLIRVKASGAPVEFEIVQLPYETP